MFDEQNGCCKTCGIEAKELKRGLFVDHCHTTGKIRGLLCGNCNSALGHTKDNIEILTNLIKYLEDAK